MKIEFFTFILRFENESTGVFAELKTIHGGSHGPDFSLNYGELVVDWLLYHRKLSQVLKQMTLVKDECKD
jgi:hypothetical protein